jgi:hypothetical protein
MPITQRFSSRNLNDFEAQSHHSIKFRGTWQFISANLASIRFALVEAFS